MPRMASRVRPDSRALRSRYLRHAMPSEHATRRTMYTPSSGGTTQRDGRLQGAIAAATRRRVRLIAVNDRPPRDDDTIRIVIADDHAVVRSGLRMLLDAESDFDVAAEAGDVDSARRYVRG